MIWLQMKKLGLEVFFGHFLVKLLIQFFKKLDKQTDRYQKLLSDINNENEKLETQIEDAQLARKETGGRETLKEEFQNLKNEKKDIEAELYEYRKVDPDNLKNLELKEKQVKNEINYYTDNILEMKRWIMEKNPGLIEEELMTFFEIPEDMDNV